MKRLLYGRAESFYAHNGQKLSEENFKDGKKMGFGLSGTRRQKIYESNYKDGKPNGLSTALNENGQKVVEGTEGRQEGRTLIYYNEDGTEMSPHLQGRLIPVED